LQSFAVQKMQQPNKGKTPIRPNVTTQKKNKRVAGKTRRQMKFLCAFTRRSFSVGGRSLILTTFSKHGKDSNR